MPTQLYCLTDVETLKTLEDGIVPILDLAACQIDSSRATWKSETNLLQSRRDVLEILKKANQSFGTVVSSSPEAQLAGQYADYIYVPGEFCRQGDVLEAAGATGKTLLIERGAFLTPLDLLRALDKAGGAKIIFVDAGSQYGYSDRVLDPRGLQVLSSAGHTFAVHLSDLMRSPNPQYRWGQGWMHDFQFVEAHIKTALAFGAQGFVYRSNGPGALQAHQIIQTINKVTHVRR